MRAMMKHGAWALPLVLAACGAGKDGAAGSAGRAGENAGACSVAQVDLGWQISCPDGTTATLAPEACEVTAGEGGAQIVRCADGTEDQLTDSELALMKLFVENPNRALHRDWLLERIAGDEEPEAFDRAIDLRIMRLRRKVERYPAPR